VGDEAFFVGLFPYPKSMRYFILLATFFFTSVSFVSGQKPFQEEINAFKVQDSLSFPGKGKILFVGSSSFRLWKNLQSDFPDHPLINRGFGGSSFPDVMMYKDEIIKPYAPKQVVVYCGENDLAGGASPEKVLSDFKALFNYVRALSADTHIAFVSIKPSPSREHILGNVKKTNEMIKEFLETQKRAVYVNIFAPMLNPDGSFREELFVQDRLHMNEMGYNIWAAAIKPHLK
jgi:lysophospholipase L1-like esterase